MRLRGELKHAWRAVKKGDPGPFLRLPVEAQREVLLCAAEEAERLLAEAVALEKQAAELRKRGEDLRPLVQVARKQIEEVAL